MLIFAPNYYNEFKCIAQDCKHSCCIGWEIDIDDASYNRYMQLDGSLGKKLKKYISTEGGAPHFILGQDERCPFLDCDNLCEIIKSQGESALCDICNDHPRFRNFFPNREEIGLGLCCEAVAELILNHHEKTEIIRISGDGNNAADEFISMRNHIFDLVQDRSMTIDNRIESLFENFGIDLPDKTPTEWLNLYLTLERLDPKWTELLNSSKSDSFVSCGDLTDRVSIALEQLLIYFLYRHLPDGLYDDMLYERAAFAILSLRIICLVCVNAVSAEHTLDMQGLIESARLYSLEIEYSDQNISTILKELAP